MRFFSITLYISSVLVYPAYSKTVLPYDFITRVNADSAPQPLWDDKLDLNKIEADLTNQHISKLIPLASYLIHEGLHGVGMGHTVYLAIMENGLKAIFKPEDKLFNSFAEVAAYRASKFLGLRLVPPTVLKKYKNLHGSLQFFVQPSSQNLRDEKAYQKLSTKDQSDMCLFYFVLGKWDSHMGNQIITQYNNKAYLALIDNTSIKSLQQVRYGEDPFICMSCNHVAHTPHAGPFPFDRPSILHNPTLVKAQQLFGRFLSARRIQHILEKNKKQIVYAIWCDNLWVQRRLRHIVRYLHHFTQKPNYSPVYYKSTIERYSKLDKSTLQNIWAEALIQDKEYFTELILQTLERRDQMLKAALKSGSIIS
jgi:hypothetical protein